MIATGRKVKRAITMRRWMTLDSVSDDEKDSRAPPQYCTSTVPSTLEWKVETKYVKRGQPTQNISK